MNKADFKALTVGQRVIVSGTQDGTKFKNERGVIVKNPNWATNDDTRTVKFDTWRDGWSNPGEIGDAYWSFERDNTKRFTITVERETAAATAPATAKKRPHGKQEYRGNGKHEWETVVGNTVRLRVPGGWLYSKTFGGSQVSSNTTFVPVPEVVGYAV